MYQLAPSLAWKKLKDVESSDVLKTCRGAYTVFSIQFVMYIFQITRTRRTIYVLMFTQMLKFGSNESRSYHCFTASHPPSPNSCTCLAGTPHRSRPAARRP